jgi:uncharacterized damage-inducible protein DinB
MIDHPSAMRDALRIMLLRDLRALDREIAAYPDDASLWITAPGISNSGGALAQHLCGNLRHFIGSTLGGTGYVRGRDAEFSTQDRSRDELRGEVQRTIDDVESALDGLTADALATRYPLPLQNRRVRTGDFLTHLAVHLTYHLGQIDYHRRILTSSKASADTVSIHDIPEYESASTD